MNVLLLDIVDDKSIGSEDGKSRPGEDGKSFGFVGGKSFFFWVCGWQVLGLRMASPLGQRMASPGLKMASYQIGKHISVV